MKMQQIMSQTLVVEVVEDSATLISPNDDYNACFSPSISQYHDSD